MANQPEYKDSLFIPQDSRSNFKQIIAKRPDLVKFNGGRLGPSQDSQIVHAGTVLGFASSGGDAGFYKPYLSTATDGSQVAVGVLSEYAAPDASGNGSEIVWISGGELLQAMLVGLDSGAISALGGRSFTEQGVQIFSF